ncbi:hypothetical protein ZWY2020_060005 [Hordeum vulgare]|nr:hypothetical protein ZWY2020_060005 [Hordeum vulgare]
MKSLLESLLKRVDAVQLAADKHVQAQLAFNEQVSSDLTHLRKQVDLTQADVQIDSPAVSAPPAAGIHRSSIRATIRAPDQRWASPHWDAPDCVTLRGGAAARPTASLLGEAPGQLHGQAAQARLPQV